MNNIKEKISAMYDGELNSSEIDELIEIVNSNKDMQKQLSLYSLINVAVNKDAYILSDRSTWESFKNKKKHTIVVENEPLLLNYYGVIPINPKICPEMRISLSQKCCKNFCYHTYTICMRTRV